MLKALLGLLSPVTQDVLIIILSKARISLSQRLLCSLTFFFPSLAATFSTMFIMILY